MVNTPPLELAIGQLSSLEQSHLQISMRVLAAHLDAPCIVVTKEEGDITFKPNANDSGTIRVVSAHEEALLERPIRLTPLSDALSRLIDGLLAHPPQPASLPPSGNPACGEATQPALLDLLLTRNPASPLEVRFASGRSLLLDERYAIAHLSSPVSDMFMTLMDESIISALPVQAGEFARRTAKGSAFHPVNVEQLCWALPAGSTSNPALDRWHKDPDARVILETWPNLSAQHDVDKWLSLLARLFQRDMPMSKLRDAAAAAGIPASRARHGISLLLTYRHAHIMATGNAVEPVVVHLPLARRHPNTSTGLLGRLRSRLRALAA